MSKRSAAVREAITSSAIFLVFAVILTFVLGGNLISAAGSVYFVPTPAVISTSTTITVTSTDTDGTVDSDDAASVGFQYTVDGTDYEANAIYIADPTPKTSMFVVPRDFLDQYPVGSKQTAFYDPDNPSVACLRRGYGPSDYAILGLLAFMWAMGLYILLWGFAKKPGLLRLRR